jgi:membrane protein DedA with SNARE-associated domain
MNLNLILFLVIFLLNIIPAFAPPTWMVFSFLGFRYPEHMGWSFALVGALAATIGRSLLGKLSHAIVRNHWLSEATRKNVDSIKLELEKRPRLTFGLFLFYAFTPLPSNFLFIAYGLTAMPLVRIALPFLMGRFVSYTIWTMSGVAVSQRLDMDDTDVIRYASIYFVLMQFAFLAAVYAFARVDWNLLLQKRKLKWLPR